MSIEKVVKLEDSIINNIKEIIGKDISSLSYKEKFFLLSFRKNGHIITFETISSLINDFLYDGIKLHQEVVILLTGIIISYLIDNNFESELNKLLSKLGISLDVLYKESVNLKNKYRGTDSYIFIGRSLEGFFYYYFYNNKKKELDLDNINKIKTISEEKILNSINELEYLIDYKNNESDYFNYINTIVSYTNYELLYVDDNNLKKKYIEIVNEHFNSLDKDYVIKQTFLSKLIFLNNLIFLENSLGNIEKFSYLKEELKNDDKIGHLTGFTLFYSGLNLDDFGISSGNVSMKNLCNILKNDSIDSINIIDIISILDVLTKYSTVKSIKDNASILYSYFINNYSKLISKNIHSISTKIENLKKELYYNLYYSIEKSIGFDKKLIENKVKNFIIQYLGLEINYHNLSFQINLNEPLYHAIDVDYIIPKKDDRTDNEIEINLGDYIVYIILPSNLENKITIEDYVDEDVKHFFNLIVDKILSLNDFLLQVEKKIDHIKEKDIETVEHMERIGKIFMMLIDKISSTSLYAKKINKLRDVFPLKKDYFYKFLGYLHDIGKSDNIGAIINYKKSNFRIEPYEILSKILIEVLPNFKPIDDELINDSTDISLFEIQKLFSNDEYLDTNIKTFFDDINMFNLKYIINGNYYKEKLIELTYKLYPYIKIKLDEISLTYNVLSNLYKDEVLNNIKDKYLINIKDNDLDIFLLTLIIILNKIGKFQVNDLTYPHIIHGLNFFQTYKDYSFLSFVLYHHSYPKKKEIIEYNQHKGLDMLNKIIGEDIDYLYGDLNENISFDKKNFLMVMLSSIDLIDALLSKRSYQVKIDFNEEILPYLSESFKKEILNVLSKEAFVNKSLQFDRAISILEEQFKNNINWKKIKLLILGKKNNILNLYN